MSCVCTRGSWFPHVKTISNLQVFFHWLLYFLFMSWYGKYRWSIEYSTGTLVLSSLLWVAWVVFVLGGRGFQMWKLFATCTYFRYTLHYFFHELVWKNLWSIKYSTGTLSFISLLLLAWVVIVLGNYGFHMWRPFAICTYICFTLLYCFSWVGMGNTGGPQNKPLGL